MVARPRRSAQEPLLDELAAVYRDADRAFAAHRCESATECCRFGVTGREPYVTSIELLAVTRAIAARGGPVAPRRRALPLQRDHAAERTCPLLVEPGRCAIYADRPLGCRTYFCHRVTVSGPAVRHPEVVALVRRVQAIATRHEPDGDRGRPLTRALS